MRGALACLIVEDINDKNSHDYSVKWKKLIDEIDCRIPSILVQNKLDLVSDKENILKKTQKIAKENNFINNFQVSAKENINIEELFEYVINLVCEKHFGKITYIDIKKMKLNVSLSMEENKQIQCCLKY